MRLLLSSALILILSLYATAESVLRTVSEALTLTAADGPGPRPFILEGQALSSTSRIFFFTDPTGGYPVENRLACPTTWKRGDLVKISGQLTVSPENQHFLLANSLVVTGHADPPTPIRTDGREIADGRHTYRDVSVTGVVSSVMPDDLDPAWNCFILRTDTKPVNCVASAAFFPLDRLHSLVDAEVSISGFVSPTSGWRRHLGQQLHVESVEDLVVIKPPPADALSIPPLERENVAHRRRVKGIVLANARGRTYLRTTVGRFLEARTGAGEPAVSPGDSVIAIGFPEYDPFRLRLTDAVLQKDADPPAARVPSAEEQSLAVEMERLFTGTGATARVDTTMHGRLLRLRGIVRTRPEVAESTGILTLDDGLRSVNVDVSALPASVLPEADSEIAATGYCLVEFNSLTSPSDFPRFHGFTLVPRNPDDLCLLVRPPWWTTRRMVALVATLLLLLIAVSFWNRRLHKLSERHGQALFEERISHARAEMKVEERTRLAVELHDAISQTLTGIALQVDSAARAVKEGKPTVLGFLATTGQTLSSCRQELQNCLWDLRTRTFEEKDMTEAVNRALSPYVGDVSAAVRFNVPREKLSESTAHAILRIVRELVANAIRHGRAKTVRIAGEEHDGTIRFSVRDDGCGFDPETAPGPAQGHFGLRGIRERLNALNGTLTVESAPGQGTKATVVLAANAQ